MQDIKLDGINSITGGEFATVSVGGVTQVEGNLKAKRVFIDGKFKSTGNVFADELHCDGIAEIVGNLSAIDIKVDGIVTLAKGNIKATTVVCDGTIKVCNKVLSDLFDADGTVLAKELLADRVNIRSRPIKFKNIFTVPPSNIGIISANYINLSGVKSSTVVGKDIVIGPGCEIKNVNCIGTLKIDKNSVINNITGKYKLL